MADTPKYDFFEKVRIRSDDPEKSDIVGRLGAILGRAQGPDGQWSYAVHVYDDEACWDCDESELEYTGQRDVRETFYDGSTMKVRVDSSGRGFLVEE